MDERRIAAADAGGIMPSSSYLNILLFCTLLAGIALAGCESTPKAGKPLHPTPTPPDAQDRSTRYDSPTAAQMNELLSRLQMLENDNTQLKQKLSDQYMQAVALKQAQIDAAKNQPRPVPPAAATNTPKTNTQSPEDQVAAPVYPAADPSALSRDELLAALTKQIKASKDPDRVKALLAAAISLATDHKQMDPNLIDALDPKSREQIARFHQMLAVTFDELASNPNAVFSRSDMIRKIDEVFGDQPLKIQTLALCRRVDSFGVFEPFASTRFLAGRQNRVLVYVELDHFKHQRLDDGTYEVRLEQSVELYDATGETTVWRQGPVQLVDVSRNKRRDFFIVYPIDLPARLPAGGYRLKVRIADKHTGSLCEQTLHDIQIVADQSLVGGQ